MVNLHLWPVVFLLCILPVLCKPINVHVSFSLSSGPSCCMLWDVPQDAHIQGPIGRACPGTVGCHAGPPNDPKHAPEAPQAAATLWWYLHALRPKNTSESFKDHIGAPFSPPCPPPHTGRLLLALQAQLLELLQVTQTKNPPFPHSSLVCTAAASPLSAPNPFCCTFLPPTTQAGDDEPHYWLCWGLEGESASQQHWKALTQGDSGLEGINGGETMCVKWHFISSLYALLLSLLE